jgi:hypothetical protein
MATDNTFGAAGTDLSQLPQGALGALGGSGTLQTAYTLANIMTPKAQSLTRRWLPCCTSLRWASKRLSRGRPSWVLLWVRVRHRQLI